MRMILWLTQCILLEHVWLRVKSELHRQYWNEDKVPKTTDVNEIENKWQK